MVHGDAQYTCTHVHVCVQYLVLVAAARPVCHRLVVVVVVVVVVVAAAVVVVVLSVVVVVVVVVGGAGTPSAEAVDGVVVVWESWLACQPS